MNKVLHMRASRVKVLGFFSPMKILLLVKNKKEYIGRCGTYGALINVVLKKALCVCERERERERERVFFFNAN